MEMAPWSFQLIRYNLFWPHSRERMTATESVMSDLKKKKNSMNANAQASQRWWMWSPLFLRRNDQDARPGRSSYSKWHGPLWTECSPEPQPVMWVIPKGCSSTHLSSLPLRPFEKRAKSPFIRISWFRQTAKPRWLWWTHCVGWNEFPCGQLPCCCLTETRGSQSC